MMVPSCRTIRRASHYTFQVADFALSWRGYHDDVLRGYDEVRPLSDLEWQLVRPVFVAAAAVGDGTGVVTPLGLAHLAATTPAERLGRTMGAAEVGRELGDAGGPLLVGAVAAAVTLGAGLAGLAV